MFDRLEETVEAYNTTNAHMGGKCFLERYRKDGSNEQHLTLSIGTPLMSHVHTRQASEMAFMHSSGSLHRHNNPVFFRCTHHPSGAFGGKGPQNGPDIFMTDDDTAQSQALQTDWKQEHSAVHLPFPANNMAMAARLKALYGER